MNYSAPSSRSIAIAPGRAESARKASCSPIRPSPDHVAALRPGEHCKEICEKTMRVLIIEDSPTNMALNTHILGAAGYTVFEAARARAGIEIARRERPDLILMDIHMPDMDGMEATRILKEDACTKDIPVIALTALAMKGDRERILGSGCDGYIEKPIRYKDFLAEVEAIAKRKAL
jgi:two-component system, cell cycle response regulator DivK